MQLKTKYKQTEAGSIPEDWTVKKLSEISPSQSVGLVINPSTYYDSAGTVPLLVGSNIHENYIDWESAKRITNESNKRLPASRLAAGDLVTVRVGEPGITAVVPPELDGCNCASMMIVRQHRSFNSQWLCFMMNSKLGRSRIEDVQYGTAQKQFNISDAVNFKYPVPPLPEQQAIAAALSDIDALIDSLNRIIAKKRDIKQAAMQQLIDHKTQLPGFTAKWDRVPLRKIIARMETGVSVNWVNDEEEDNSEHSQYVLKVSAVTNGCFDPTERKKIATRDLARAKCNPRANTIIVSRANTPDLVGECGFVTCNYSNLFLPDKLWMLSTHNGTDPRWLAYTLASQRYKLRLKEAATGTSGSMKNISKSSFLEIEVNLPSHDEQTAMANIFADMDAEIFLLERQRVKTQLLRRGMMQQLLTGRVRLV